MLTIYFFYGLAFIILSAIIFLMPRREGCLGLDKSIIFVGWFGLLHGLNEWIDLLILAGRSFNIETLSIIGSALLPLSFTFLIIFGCVAISNIRGGLKWIGMVLVFFPLLWASISITSRNLFVSEIFARYLLCVPGTILTSLAIYLSLRRCDAHITPKPVIAGAWITIVLFLLYGVFGGMVTLKASFFPASALNYPSFIKIFHLPVQFLRMVCAFMISCGLILLIGTFSEKRLGQTVKGTIKHRITAIIAASVVIITFAGAILTYFAGSVILINILGKQYAQIAHTLSVYTVDALNREIENAVSYATRPLWKDAIADVNLKYSKLSKIEIEDYMAQMDKKWSTAEKGSLFLIEYLRNRISVGMQETVQTRSGISEIFITDKYGGLVSSSDRTTDFYQADEEWWQRAYNGGKGSIYVSDIEFNESSKGWVISIAVPIKDLKSGEIIGICKDSIGIGKLFGSLVNLRLGNTGHAVLIDNNGTVIFHHGVSMVPKNIFPGKTLHKIREMKNSYLMLKTSILHDKKTFIAFNEIKPPYLSDRGISWIMLVVQDASEVTAPINNFIIQIAMISILMMVLIIPVGSFFGNLIAGPIHELHLATERIMAGDWDYKIDVKTGDEIEQFAGTFRDMITDIKKKQKELQSFSNGLEIKVEGRTKELNVAQEATLNILEDLQVAKEALENTNKELMKLDELKSEFISTVSHELRTPLSIIKEGISLVLDKIPGEINEKQSKILDISKYNIDRLARIIDSLLDISKIEAGKVELRRGLISISDIVKQTANSFESRIKDKGLEMHLDMDNAIGSVWVDADRITQVLTNLIGNAIKFTSSGSIDISCKDKGDAVVCSVSDTGAGIAKEDMHKLFDKFQQFGRVAGAGDKGTGLGLSIAKGIIDMHNGTIWAESEPGKGSRFMFKLRKYTSQSLFTEYVSKAVKSAADRDAKMSIIAVSSSLTGRDESGVISKRFNDIIHDSASLIKNTLKREGDDVVSSGSEMIVILADCNKENAARVQYRLEEIVGKYLTDQNANDAIKLSYGYATYPDDAKSDLELIDKAKAVLAVSAKA